MFRKEDTLEFDLIYKNLNKCKTELVKVITYIDLLTYVDTPDYSYIYALIREAASSANFKIDDPYGEFFSCFHVTMFLDWEREEDTTKRHSTKV